MESSNYIAKDLKSWEEYKSFVDKSRLEWIYRGQASSNWGLSSTLERSNLVQNFPQIEEEILEEFERVAKFYLKTNEVPSNKIEWFALIQHFGSPTRLIDFSKSPYVAAYFAFEQDNNESENVAIWVINKTAFAQKAVYYLEGKIKNNLYSKSYTFSEKSFNEIFEKYGQLEINCVIPVESYSMNERYYLQQSIFLAPCNPEETFNAQLDFLKEIKRKSIIKFTMPANERKKALRDLYKMNITRASLFPGLDGFAKTINMKYNTLTKIGEIAKHIDFLKKEGLL